MDRTECALPPPVPSAMGQREAAAPGGEAGARPPPAETCRAGCGVGCRPRAAPAPRPPPEHRPGAGRNRQRRPRDPRPTPPGPGAAEELRGEQERGPCCGRLRGWGSFCTGIKRVFPRIGSPAPFFEGDVRGGGGVLIHSALLGAPGPGGTGGGGHVPAPPPCDLRPPGAAVGRMGRGGRGRGGRNRETRGGDGTEAAAGPGAEGPVTGIVRVGGPGTVTRLLRGSGPGPCGAAGLSGRRCRGRCPTPLPPLRATPQVRCCAPELGPLLSLSRPTPRVPIPHRGDPGDSRRARAGV